MESGVKTGIKAPRGRELACKGWHQEAALRMLMNNLDREVAERPDDLIIYGGSGKVARKQFGGNLKGKILLTGGLGGMGGAQPLAATMLGAAFLGIDVDFFTVQKGISKRKGTCF